MKLVQKGMTCDPTGQYMDAKFTSMNTRDRKQFNKAISYPKPYLRRTFDIDKKHYMPMSEQAKYKYIIVVEGHSAASRLCECMETGSVILYERPRESYASNLWFTNDVLQKKLVLEIAPNLSNLLETIQWCQTHDRECEELARQSTEYALKHIGSIDAMTAYLSTQLNKISTHVDDVKYCSIEETKDTHS
jgi:hypothetical protein